jgi:hypothetical protein
LHAVSVSAFSGKTERNANLINKRNQPRKSILKNNQSFRSLQRIFCCHLRCVRGVAFFTPAAERRDGAPPLHTNHRNEETTVRVRSEARSEQLQLTGIEVRLPRCGRGRGAQRGSSDLHQSTRTLSKQPAASLATTHIAGRRGPPHCEGQQRDQNKTQGKYTVKLTWLALEAGSCARKATRHIGNQSQKAEAKASVRARC